MKGILPLADLPEQTATGGYSDRHEDKRRDVGAAGRVGNGESRNVGTYNNCELYNSYLMIKTNYNTFGTPKMIFKSGEGKGT